MLDQDVMSRVAAYRGNPAQLQQKYAAGQDLLDLLALQKIKSEKEAAARQMQLQMSKQQAANGEAPMTIAQQREKEVMDMTKQELAQQRGDTLKQQQSQKMAQFNKLMGGIAGAPGAQSAAAPKAMAAGGIVALAGGGTALDQAKQRVQLAQQKLRTYGLNQRRDDPEGFRAAQEELASAQAALSEAEQGYAQEMSAAGVDRPAFRRQDVGAVRAAMTPPTQPAATSPVGDIRGLMNQAESPLRSQPAAPAGLGALVQQRAPRPNALPTSIAGGQGPAPQAAPAQPKPAGVLGAPAMPIPTLIPGMRESIEQDVRRDPMEQQKSEESRITEKLGMSPQEQAAIEHANATRRKYFEEEYDPERQRREALKQFLIGAGGRAYGEFGAGAKAAGAYEAQQRAAKLKEFEDMQKGIMEPFARQREAAKMGIEGGIKGLEAASAQRRTGQSTGASIYGTETDRYTREREGDRNRQLEREKMQLRQIMAGEGGAQDSAGSSKAMSRLTGLLAAKDRIIDAVNRQFSSELNMVLMGLQANPKDKTLIARKAAIEAERNAELARRTRDYDMAQATIEAELYGRAGPGATGGYTVQKVAPTK